MKVKRGGSRTVLIFRSVVVKVPIARSWRLCLYGMIGNLHERAWGKQSTRLARVIWGDPLGLVLIQERAYQTKKLTSKRLAMCKHLFDGLPVYDWNTSNFGFVGRRLVCLDYGLEKLPPFRDPEYFLKSDSYF